MARVFHITGPLRGSGGAPCSFPLRVPCAEVPARDLVACVQDRLALPPDVAFFFAAEPEAGQPPAEEAIPLTPHLPDGTALRLVLAEHGGPAAPPAGPPPLQRPVPQLREQSVMTPDLALSTLTAPDAGYGQQLLDDGQAAQPRARRRCLFEQRPLPGCKEINTDLANERTVLAWIRTGLAVLRTVFSFATLNGLSRGGLLVDVVITILLACSGFASFVVGWQRFRVVRKLGIPGARRLSVWPMLVVFTLISSVCVVAVVLKEPRKIWDPARQGCEVAAVQLSDDAL